MIEFTDVEKSYAEGNVALRGITMQIEDGEFAFLVGPSGSGKSTIIKLITGELKPTAGAVHVNGYSLERIRKREIPFLRRTVGVVFQDFRLLAFSVQENVLLGREDTPEAVDSVLEKVGLLDKVNTLPHGRDTMMFRQFEKDGVQLSGGEQQKLAIARALYKNAPVVILDEPTAALDPVAEYEIYCRFNELVGGKTAVYISHRLSSCKFCDRIALFSDCTIKELGTHDELVHKPGGIYAEMFAAQAQYYV